MSHKRVDLIKNMSSEQTKEQNNKHAAWQYEEIKLNEETITRLKDVWFKWEQTEAQGIIEVVLIKDKKLKLIVFKNRIGNVLFKGHIFDKSYVTKCK